MELTRCKWCNLKNPIYVAYHDHEWGVPSYQDHHLFELLILEFFQAGLSWETILMKRENFRRAFDGFNIDSIADYDEEKVQALMNDSGIIRNKMKIQAAVTNSKVFRQIQNEWGTFSDYIWHFTDGNIIYETDRTSSPLSDEISKDLKKRGMKFIGTTIIYSYLQAVGIINSHDKECFKYVIGE